MERDWRGRNKQKEGPLNYTSIEILEAPLSFKENLFPGSKRDLILSQEASKSESAVGIRGHFCRLQPPFPFHQIQQFGKGRFNGMIPVQQTGGCIQPASIG